MSNLQDRVMIFHNYANGCPGIIVTRPPGPSDPPGRATLQCAECGLVVGYIDEGAFDQLLELMPGTADAERTL